MAICEKCIKKSVCKLCDGSEIMGCIEFVSLNKVILNGQPLPDDCEILTREAYADLCIRASKCQEPNCSEIPTGSTAKIDVPDNNVGNIDCISRADLYNRIKGIDHDEDYECDEFGGSRITYHTCGWDEVLREIEDAPSVTPQEPFINKSCVSSGVCEHDKQKVLDKIRAEIKGMTPTYHNPDWSITDLVPIIKVIDVVDKYKAEIEPQESEAEDGNDN